MSLSPPSFRSKLTSGCAFRSRDSRKKSRYHAREVASSVNSHLFPRTYSFPSLPFAIPASLVARELIGFAKLITRIYISPRKRFSFLPWPEPPASLTFRRRRRRPGMQRGGRIILVEKFVITLTISVSLSLSLSSLYIHPSVFSPSCSGPRVLPFHSGCSEPSRCVTPLRFRSSRHCPPRRRAVSSATAAATRVTRFVVQDN